MGYAMSIKIERSEKTGRWIKSTKSSGTCFTISPDRFEQILKTGKLSPDFPNWHLEADESVERYEFNEHGITVFIKKG